MKSYFTSKNVLKFLAASLIIGTASLFFLAWSIFAFLTVAIWIWFLPLFLLITCYIIIQKGRQILILSKIILKLTFFEYNLNTEEWKYLYETFIRQNDYKKIDSINYGYAILSEEGIYLENYRQSQQVLNYQLYDYAILMNASIKDMRGKTLLEVSCGRGGGLKYIIDEF